LKANATLEYSYTYQPYGGFRSNKKNDAGAVTNFNKMTFDSELKDTGTTGFVDLRARMLDPTTGSFLTADPASMHPDYTFATGNPAMFADPTGRFSLRGGLDWFNKHLNPGYAYLQGCFGSDGSQSLGSWLAGCTFASGLLATSAVGLGESVVKLGGLATSTEAAEGELARVGRWMSPEEHAAMVDSGVVQEGAGGVTNVAFPASVESYMQQAASGARYVEFDVASSSLSTGGKLGWATIRGPNSWWARYGLANAQMPRAFDIEWIASKL
jgi:RHS repeat-associated protein